MKQSNLTRCISVNDFLLLSLSTLPTIFLTYIILNTVCLYLPYLLFLSHPPNTACLSLSTLPLTPTKHCLSVYICPSSNTHHTLSVCLYLSFLSHPPNNVCLSLSTPPLTPTQHCLSVSIYPSSHTHQTLSSPLSSVSSTSRSTELFMRLK